MNAENGDLVGLTLLDEEEDLGAGKRVLCRIWRKFDGDVLKLVTFDFKI